jgi:uncharacterized protein (TIGR03435 family)
MIRSIGIVVSIVLTSLGIVLAQPGSLAFEVASIRPTTHAQDRGIDTSFSGSHATFTKVDVFTLMAFAYVDPRNGSGTRILGGPSWIQSEKYDVIAKAEGEGKRSDDEIREMVKSLLADRFKLTMHREMRELPAYALMIAKNGPKLLEPKESDNQAPAATWTAGQMTALRLTMASFAGTLRTQVGDPVFDETGLAERYAFTLNWDPNEFRSNGAAVPSSKPSLFTALQEQLGLKLERVKRPIEHLVIDNVEKPSENWDVV